MIASLALGLTLGPKVALMLHGAGGGGWEYVKWRPVFEQAGWTVVAPDMLPGNAGLAATTFDDYAMQSWAAVPSHRSRLVLIGASMGGPLALRVAERADPDAVVLINSVIPAGTPGLEPFEWDAPEIIEWEGGPLQDSIDAMPDSDMETVRFAHARWRNESGRMLKELLNGVKVSKPTAPTLVIISGQDTDVPPEMSRSLAKHYDADTRYYENASHVGPLLARNAPAIAKDALDWIDQKVD